jgi:hypothetical protein
MGANQSVKAEKHKIESDRIIRDNINKLHELKEDPVSSSETMGVVPADTFKDTYD